MTSFDVARAVHVLAVVWWLGGVATMTTIVAPALRRTRIPAVQQKELLRRIRRRFVLQARIALLLIGASGATLLWGLGGIQRLTPVGGGRLDLMLITWSLFVLLLFVLEPLGLTGRLLSNPRAFLSLQTLMLNLATTTVAIAILFAQKAL